MVAKAKTEKKAVKASAKKKPEAKMKKGDAYECRICGYRVIVDEACGCAEEHVFVCCGQNMAKRPAAA
ncbi:MAG: hypothetical protein ACUVV5_10590 [Candidatus Aminicenantales bacterium]